MRPEWILLLVRSRASRIPRSAFNIRANVRPGLIFVKDYDRSRCLLGDLIYTHLVLANLSCIIRCDTIAIWSNAKKQHDALCNGGRS